MAGDSSGWGWIVACHYPGNFRSVVLGGERGLTGSDGTCFMVRVAASAMRAFPSTHARLAIPGNPMPSSDFNRIETTDLKEAALD